MRFAVNLTKAEADLVKAARDKLAPPLIGTQVGGGRHVDMPESWDGEGAVPIGWTGFAGPLKDGATWKLPLPVEIDAADKTALSAQEKARLLGLTHKEFTPEGDDVPVEAKAKELQ